MEAFSRLLHSKRPKSKGPATVEKLVSERDRHLQEEHAISQQIQAIKSSMKYWNCRTNNQADFLAKEKSLKELEKKRARLNCRLAMLGHQLLEADEECQLSSSNEDQETCSLPREEKLEHTFQYTLITS